MAAKIEVSQLDNKRETCTYAMTLALELVEEGAPVVAAAAEEAELVEALELLIGRGMGSKKKDGELAKEEEHNGISKVFSKGCMMLQSVLLFYHFLHQQSRVDYSPTLSPRSQSFPHTVCYHPRLQRKKKTYAAATLVGAAEVAAAGEEDPAAAGVEDPAAAAEEGATEEPVPEEADPVPAELDPTQEVLHEGGRKGVKKCSDSASCLRDDLRSSSEDGDYLTVVDLSGGIPDGETDGSSRRDINVPGVGSGGVLDGEVLESGSGSLSTGNDWIKSTMKGNC